MLPIALVALVSAVAAAVAAPAPAPAPAQGEGPAIHPAAAGAPAPVRSGRVHANGAAYYYEIHGSGELGGAGLGGALTRERGGRP
jgi:hypothetical protein